MGCYEREAKYPDEKPRFTCLLIRQPYRISRYPVTVAQFELFVKAGGYAEARYWPEAKAAKVWNEGQVKGWSDEAWRDEPQGCNLSGTGIGHTSPVGMFPEGNAAYGAVDMAGNVWEWCRPKWLGNYKGYEKKVDDSLAGEGARVLRGGSWDFSRDVVRCVFRSGVGPGSRDSYVGFRVAASPFVSGL